MMLTATAGQGTGGRRWGASQLAALPPSCRLTVLAMISSSHLRHVQRTVAQPTERGPSGAALVGGRSPHSAAACSATSAGAKASASSENNVTEIAGLRGPHKSSRHAVGRSENGANHGTQRQRSQRRQSPPSSASGAAKPAMEHWQQLKHVLSHGADAGAALNAVRAVVEAQRHGCLLPLLPLPLRQQSSSAGAKLQVTSTVVGNAGGSAANAAHNGAKGSSAAANSAVASSAVADGTPAAALRLLEQHVAAQWGALGPQDVADVCWLMAAGGYRPSDAFIDKVRAAAARRTVLPSNSCVVEAMQCKLNRAADNTQPTTGGLDIDLSLLPRDVIAGRRLPDGSPSGAAAAVACGSGLGAGGPAVAGSA